MAARRRAAGTSRWSAATRPFSRWVQFYNLAMPVTLTPKERTHLKGRAHALEPIVQVGQGGLSDAVAVELDRALTAHGLIKVKINGTDRRARQAMAVAICSRTDAVAIHQVGKIIVLWRPTPEEAPASSSE